MRRKILGKTSVFLMAACLSACGVQPPKCSDESTLSLIKKVVADHFDGVGKLSREEILANISFTNSRAAAYDEQVKKYGCEANVVIGDKYEVPITYTSQLDDNGQQIVSVNSISQAGLNAIYLGFVIVSRKLKPEAQTNATIEAEPNSQTTSNPSTNPNGSLELPDISPREPYGQVREKMLSAGWQPFHIESADICRDGDQRCQDRPEMASCSGSGLANCRFLWKKDEKTIGICTIGEGEPTFSNYCQD